MKNLETAIVSRLFLFPGRTAPVRFGYYLATGTAILLFVMLFKEVFQRVRRTLVTVSKCMGIDVHSGGSLGVAEPV